MVTTQKGILGRRVVDLRRARAVMFKVMCVRVHVCVRACVQDKYKKEHYQMVPLRNGAGMDCG